MTGRSASPYIVAALTAAFLVSAAVGRQSAFQPISSTDLAFYHQATWSAAHGLGFAQTALRFDGSTLTGCIHFDVLRAVLVPFYALWPSISTLVGLQALSVALGVLPILWIVRQDTGSTTAATLAALAYAVHPLTLELACVDLRPIVFMAPGALLVVASIRQSRVAGLILGGLVVITAREEGPWVLLSLLPFAMREGWRGRSSWRMPLLLAGVAATGLVVLLAVWGRFTNIAAAEDPVAVLAAIREGSRPLFRSPAELEFGVTCLGAALLAVLEPFLLLPAMGAWGVLTILSGYESVSAGGRGIHYLAVVHPLLMAAAAGGLARLAGGRRAGGSDTQEAAPERRSGVRRRAVVVGAVGLELALALVLGLPQLRMASGWVATALAGRTPEQAALAAHLEPVLEDPAPVLTEPLSAGVLANRQTLHIIGEFSPDPGVVQQVVGEVGWAVLEDGGDSGAEAALWRGAVAEAGFKPQGSALGRTVWRRQGDASIPRPGD